MSDELKKLRDGIDQLDAEIIDRIARRAELARRIGEIKQGHIYRPEREAQVLRRIAAHNPGPLPDAALTTVFREIMSACLSLEQPLTIAYLGPQGTFSQAAARKAYGSAPTAVPQASIDEVFRAVEAGRAHYGVVPVENSTEGAVGRTLDMLLDASLQICGEVNLRVHQNLLSLGAEREAITRVYSHAQSLAQCHAWLNANVPQAERIAVSSNAEAARLASLDATSAAVASAEAGALYQLATLAAHIEDDPNNTTRFLMIGHHDAGPSGRDKTSLVCATPNRPGAMYGLLEPLSAHHVSMTKLESRPARAGLWEYVFYIDIEGHRSEPKVVAALGELSQRASFLKVLGSYPCALD
ncbi:MAG: chorismate mutase/prephenate dehydratase [Pseudomonadota bacterium]|jgi:chorismate mutase/prephenate dehydratase